MLEWLPHRLESMKPLPTTTTTTLQTMSLQLLSFFFVQFLFSHR